RLFGSGNPILRTHSNHACAGGRRGHSRVQGGGARVLQARGSLHFACVQQRRARRVKGGRAGEKGELFGEAGGVGIPYGESGHPNRDGHANESAWSCRWKTLPDLLYGLSSGRGTGDAGEVSAAREVGLLDG